MYNKETIVEITTNGYISVSEGNTKSFFPIKYGISNILSMVSGVVKFVNPNREFYTITL